MSQSEKQLELTFTGKNPKEYFNNDKKQCVFCNGHDGDEEVIKVNGTPALGKVKVKTVTFTKDSMNISFNICTKHLNFFNGLMEMWVSLLDGSKKDNQAMQNPFTIFRSY